jgi:hypothetical protein
VDYQEILPGSQYDPHAYPTDEDSVAQQMEQVSNLAYLSRPVNNYIHNLDGCSFL